MPRRQDDRPRVLGPVWCASKGYWRVTTIDPEQVDPRNRSRERYFAEREEAQEYRDLKAAALERLRGVTVKAAIDGYKQHLNEKGTGAVSYNETVRRLQLFFPDHAMLIGRVTTERAEQYYKVFRQRRKVRKDGSDAGPISVSYHRAALINARSFANWCVKQGWLPSNPFAAVEGIGQRNAGKLQHTGDESRKFYSYCWTLAQNGDNAALGVLMALSMALRSSDITRRIVRDVDLDSTVLRITDGKTKKSNEPREIPLALQPLLRQLVAGRDPFEPLFKTPYTKTGHHTRRWLEEAMSRFCEAAGVPYVCPHALKGTAGSILAKRGALGNQIFEYLSHEEGATTKRHYVPGDAIEQAETRAGLALIMGGNR